MNTEDKNITLTLIKQMSDRREPINAMTLARKFNQFTGKHTDWHEFSFYLDSLYNQKFLKVVSGGGWVVYDLNI